MAGTESQPVAGSQAPAPTPDAGTTPPACAPIDWANPGKVEVPVIESVAADAGNGKPFAALAGLEAFAYEHQESFLTGASPAFTTRMNVYKPKDPARFSGTVFVEWYDVSSQLDLAMEWASSREYFMREGHGYVAVSAQSLGVDHLKRYDSQRYAKLQHPGDSFAEAIFSRAGVALKTHANELLGPCYPVHALIATGNLQAALRLASYIDNVQATDRVYDGFMLHSGLEPRTSDPGVPVMELFTMSEAPSTPDDGPMLVKWMIAGATLSARRTTTRSAEVAMEVSMAVYGCVDSMNDFPAHRAYNAAFAALHEWVRNGKRPQAAPRFERSAFGGLSFDDNLNVVGGLRLPEIEVPIATYSTTNTPSLTDPTGGLACSLGGTAARFSPQRLEMLYPTHDDYVTKYKAAADRSLAAGHLLQADYDEALKEAQAAPIPR